MQYKQQLAGFLHYTESVRMPPLLGKLGLSLYGDNVYLKQEKRRSKAMVTACNSLEKPH